MSESLEGARAKIAFSSNTAAVASMTYVVPGVTDARGLIAGQIAIPNSVHLTYAQGAIRIP
jgi:hypothetical protein